MDQGNFFNHKLFASSLTCALFSVFLYPLLATCHLVGDRNVRFWIGYYPLIVLILPVMWLAAHVYHVIKGKGSYSVVMACTIIPCVTFFLVGGSILFQATHIVDGLVTTDCAHFRTIRPIEAAYQDAATILQACHAEKPGAVLAMCSDYIDEYDVDNHASTWSYLEYLETNYHCHGFCSSAPTGLWTPDTVSFDACSVAVASVMKGRVQHAAWQLMMYDIGVLFLFLAWITPMARATSNQKNTAKSNGGPPAYGTYN